VQSVDSTYHSKRLEKIILTAHRSSPIFRFMIKKVTILILFASLLFGAMAPAVASIVQQPEACGMECCDSDASEMDMHHSSGMQIKDMQTCSFALQCIPVNIPDGLDLTSTIPVLKTKVKVYVVTGFINMDTEQTTQRDRVNLAHDFLVPDPASEVLSTHSVLIL